MAACRAFLQTYCQRKIPADSGYHDAGMRVGKIHTPEMQAKAYWNSCALLPLLKPCAEPSRPAFSSKSSSVLHQPVPFGVNDPSSDDPRASASLPAGLAFRCPLRLAVAAQRRSRSHDTRGWLVQVEASASQTSPIRIRRVLQSLLPGEVPAALCRETAEPQAVLPRVWFPCSALWWHVQAMSSASYVRKV